MTAKSTAPSIQDIDRWRSQTKGCNEVLHFNNAGAALMPDTVYDTVSQHLDLERRIGAYEASDNQAQSLQNVYTSIANMLRAQPDEIALIENATRAWDMAFYSINFKPGDRILTAKSEYASNYIAYLQIAGKHGVQIEVIPDDEHGQVDVQALKNAIDDRVKLIAITHVPTQGGLINPAEQIGKVAREAGVLYLLDACQSVGQLDLDVNALGCDMLSATGRKYLRGPRGTGFLYVKKDLIESLEPPFLDLHAADWTGPQEFAIRKDARRFENWESYVAGKLGLGAAVDYAMSIGLANIQSRVTDLAATLRARLSTIPHVTVKDKGANKCGIVTFVKDNLSVDAIKMQLRTQKINVSASRMESARLDMQERNETAFVRASVHYYNTEAEIDRFCEAVAAL